MKKRIVSVLCILALFLSMCGNIYIPATAVEEKRSGGNQAGFARVDINPYVVDGDPSSGIMALPLAGTGDVWNRLSQNTLLDDNGDGVIDENDGLKATVIAVSDGDGDTLLLITVDVIGMTFYSKITEAIAARVEAALASGELTGVKLNKENIYAASTHTHNAPDTGSYSASGKTGTNNAGVDLSVVNANLGLWIDRTVEDIADAAILALKDRASTTITKDQLSASQVTSDVVKGKTLCSTRHYVTNEGGGESFVAGDNFNGTSTTTSLTSRGDDPQQITEADDNIYLLNFAFEDPSKLPIVLANWRSHPSLNNSDSYENVSKTKISSDYVSAFRHALEMGVDVVIDTNTGVESVKSWTLGTQQKYRVAFFNGTGGNTNPSGTEIMKDENGNVLTYDGGKTHIGSTWISVSASNAQIKGSGCSYGVVLATFANECITDGKNETKAQGGEITSATKTFKADRKTVGCSQLAYDAGQAYNAAVALYNAADATYLAARSAYYAYVEAQNKVDSAPFLGELLYGSARDKAKSAYETAMASHNEVLAPYVEYMTANTNNKATNSFTGTSYAAFPDQPNFAHPFLYKNAAGEVFAVGSKYHAGYVIGDWNNALGTPYTAGINVTVNAFMIGEDIAFVTIPGEPFDYYYKERGIYTPENNMWNDLVGEGYGRPYIMGYTNGWQRYFPNIEAYYYNEGSVTKTFASYEVHNSDFEAGTGERAINALDTLLTALESDSREAYCAHCGKDVVWTPFCKEMTMASGHYYLCSDYELANQLRFEADCTVCFDLNGHTLTGVGRAFYLDDNKNETLNIMDTSASSNGVVQGCAGEVGAARAYGGGTVYIGPGSTLNLYSGTMAAYERTNYSCTTGTVVRARGNFNIYGGKVEGGAAAGFTGQYVDGGKPVTATRTGQGGAIYVDGALSLYGGSVTGGKLVKITGEVWGDSTVGYGYRQTVEEVEGLWPCVYIMAGASVTLAGDGSVEKMYLAGGPAAKLTVKGAYTGSVELGYPSGTAVTVGTKIGAAEAFDGVTADVSQAHISYQNVQSLTAAVKGAQLLVSDTSRSFVYCEHCKSYPDWIPVTDAELDKSTNTTGMMPGHYVLTENVTTTQKQLKNAGTYCFDLNGFEFHGATRAFYVYNNVTLNIQDSSGGAFVQGDNGNGFYAGSIYCQDANGVVNIYGTTVKGTPKTSKRGGAIYIVNGTVNLYDAEVMGNHSSEYGGAIFVGTNAKLNVHGGTLTAGQADIKGNCVFVDTSGKMSVSGDAVIDEIYINGAPAAALTVNTTEQSFSGTAVLNFTTAITAAGTDIGDITGTLGLQNANLSIAGSDLKVQAQGTNLVTLKPVAYLCAEGAELVGYNTLGDAVNAYTAAPGQFVRLVADTAENITISQNMYLDLNGFDITGNVTVEENATVYCMDSQTDDYVAMDAAGYGRLTGTVTGNVDAVAAHTISAPEAVTDYRAGYLMVSREEGLSFHRVNLQVQAMVLRPAVVGVYYECPFKVDEVVAEDVESFGVALSVWCTPDATNLESKDCAYSVFYDIEDQDETTEGTLLVNIMSDKKTDRVNESQSKLSVHGRAYIKLANQVVFGDPVSRSLQEQVIAVDATWDTLSDVQRQGVLEMYATYEDVMSGWNIPNIKAAYLG